MRWIATFIFESCIMVDLSVGRMLSVPSYVIVMIVIYAASQVVEQLRGN